VGLDLGHGWFRRTEKEVVLCPMAQAKTSDFTAR
jgi:hypothetical protein